MKYRDSGVDIDAGNTLVEGIKETVLSTHSDNVIRNYGGFAAMYSVPKGYSNPVMVSCTDGVGTKLKLAQEYGFHDTVGQDLVAMCVNDLYCTGADPLFFLDYLASGKLDVNEAQTVIQSIARACRYADCSLVGGETAEMPGMYNKGEYDLAGFCVGVVEEEHAIRQPNIRAGDLLVGLGSSGPHSNGYSLIREIMKENMTFSDQHLAYYRQIIAPTIIYKGLNTLLRANVIGGMAHITGGGLIENIPRMLPEYLNFELTYSEKDFPTLFKAIMRVGQVDESEMLRTFNCGVGMVLAIQPEMLTSLLTYIGDKYTHSIIGTITK